MFKRFGQLIVWCLVVSSTTVFAFEKGEALSITLSNGKVVKGTLLNETANGFLVKTVTGATLVNYGDVADITSGAQPAARPTPAPPTPARRPLGDAPPPQRPQYTPPPPQYPQYEVQPRAGDFTSRVHIFSKSERQRWDVEFGGRSCTTPCELDLPPGTHHLLANGEGRIEADLTMPFGESNLMLQPQSGVSGVGVAFSLIGAAGAVVGLFVMLFASVVGGLVAIAISATIALVGTIMVVAAPKAKAVLKPGPRRSSELEVVEPAEPLMQVAFGN